MQIGGTRNILIEITARHFKAPKVLRNFVEKEIRKLSKYFDGVLDYHVILTHSDGMKEAEIVANSKGHHFAANDADPKMDRAVVLAVEKMKVQLNRHKEKLVEK
ncbi:MAG: ribosome-associated translation inhibitor RaiA [Candidatus Marinimicrobia bacterium]|nr:ribosome-associated translation inhibitor RaiA [Candidatus Neomarinimicrobiota bacterium]